jgi:hypothetical protein
VKKKRERKHKTPQLSKKRREFHNANDDPRNYEMRETENEKRKGKGKKRTQIKSRSLGSLTEQSYEHPSDQKSSHS